MQLQPRPAYSGRGAIVWLSTAGIERIRSLLYFDIVIDTVEISVRQCGSGQIPVGAKRFDTVEDRVTVRINECWARAKDIDLQFIGQAIAVRIDSRVRLGWLVGLRDRCWHNWNRSRYRRT